MLTEFKENLGLFAGGQANIIGTNPEDNGIGEITEIRENDGTFEIELEWFGHGDRESLEPGDPYVHEINAADITACNDQGLGTTLIQIDYGDVITLHVPDSQMIIETPEWAVE